MSYGEFGIDTNEFIKFFNSQGIKIVDANTGEEIKPKKEFDRDKFANDFEEEHGWCPDAGYEEIKK